MKRIKKTKPIEYHKIIIPLCHRDKLVALILAFADVHLDYHNLSNENEIILGIPLHQFNWRQRLASALSKVGIVCAPSDSESHQ